jgi:WD40 repeat protein
LINLLRGDLDWIVMKCLEKDRSRRYETANGLAIEVKRHLNNEPVLASPPSATYRLGKFAKAHRAMLATIAIVVSMLIVGTAVSTWLAVRATQAEKLAASRLGAEAEARQEADQARQQAVNDRKQAQRRLYEARLAQAKASRWSGQLGRRYESLRGLAEAAQIARELSLGGQAVMELRNEAIACMALADLQLVREWEGYPPGSAGTVAFDANLERYARSDSKGNISVRRVDNDQELASLPGEGSGAALLAFALNGDGLIERNWHRFPGQSTNFRMWNWQHRTNLWRVSFGADVVTFDHSSDGLVLALALTDGTVLLVEAASGRELGRLKIGLAPVRVGINPQGSKLAVTLEGRHEVQVRDIATGELHWNASVPVGLSGLAWHPDGTLLAAGCLFDVHLWNVQTGRPHAVSKGHHNAGVDVVFSPRGNLLMSSAWDDTTHIWNPWTGRQLLSFPAAVGWFNVDGTRFASRTATMLSLWEVASASEYRTLPSRPGASMYGLSFSEDGRWLAAAAADGIRIWDLERDKECAFVAAKETYAAIFHPKQRELITSSSAGLLSWPLQIEAEVLKVGDPRKISSVEPFALAALDQNGRILVVGTRRGGVIRNLERPSDAGFAFEHHNARDVAISSNGQWIASGTHNGNGIRVWDASSGKLVAELLPDARKSMAAFSPDGRWLVGSTDTDGFCFWKVPSWELVRRVTRRSGQDPGCVAFAANGKMTALEMSPGVVQLLDTEIHQPIAILQGPDTDNYNVLCFSPDGSQLAMIVGSPPCIQVWDLRQIRGQLQELGLDWAEPSYPSALSVTR